MSKEVLTNDTEIETSGPITLPDRQIFVTSGENYKFLALLTENPNDIEGNIPIVPMDEVDKLYDGSKRRRGQQSLTDWRQSKLDNGRQALKPRGWGITRTIQKGTDSKLHEIVFLSRIEGQANQGKNSQRKDEASVKKHQTGDSKFGPPYLDVEGARAFFLELRRENPGLYKEDSDSLPTSSPEPVSPEDKVHS